MSMSRMFKKNLDYMKNTSGFKGHFTEFVNVVSFFYFIPSSFITDQI